jgi:hypothetical protein
MARLPLDRVEELVEESVFHPSPCKRHRERVLRDAAQATFRQKISHRMIVAVSAASVVLGIGIFSVRMATTPGEATSAAAAPASAPTAPAVEVQTPPSSPPAVPAGSLGEGLYRSADPSDAKPAESRGL